MRYVARGSLRERQVEVAELLAVGLANPAVANLFQEASPSLRTELLDVPLDLLLLVVGELLLGENAHDRTPCVDVGWAALVGRRLVVALLLHRLGVQSSRLPDADREVAVGWQSTCVEDCSLKMPTIHAVAHGQLAESDDVLVELARGPSHRLLLPGRLPIFS